MVINAASLSGNPQSTPEKYQVQFGGSQDTPIEHDVDQGTEMQLQYTFDTNLEQVLGRMPLTDPDTGRLKVDSLSKDIYFSGQLASAGELNYFMVNCEGYNTATIQATGTWAGTVSFWGSNMPMGGALVALQGVNIATGAVITTTTTVAVFRFPITGLRRIGTSFSSVTSGVPQIIITLSPTVSVIGVPNSIVQASTVVQGSAAVALAQVPTSTVGPLISADGGLTQNALSGIDFWNPYTQTAALGGGYQPGDTVLWAGPGGISTVPQVYRCILATTGVSPSPMPTNTTYWVYDFRQNKSVISHYANVGPDKSRVRVEIDQDAYKFRVTEQQELTSIQSEWDALAENDTINRVEQGGYNDSLGSQYAQAYSGSSYYNIMEVR